MSGLTLSGDQSKDAIGWVEMLTFWSLFTVPITPISRPSLSSFTRKDGYELRNNIAFEVTF